jgi:hypothetical protein
MSNVQNEMVLVSMMVLMLNLIMAQYLGVVGTVIEFETQKFERLCHNMDCV